MQRHEFSVDVNAPPEEVWEVFWYRGPDRPAVEDRAHRHPASRRRGRRRPRAPLRVPGSEVAALRRTRRVVGMAHRGEAVRVVALRRDRQAAVVARRGPHAPRGPRRRPHPRPLPGDATKRSTRSCASSSNAPCTNAFHATTTASSPPSKGVCAGIGAARQREAKRSDVSHIECLGSMKVTPLSRERAHDDRVKLTGRSWASSSSAGRSSRSSWRSRSAAWPRRRDDGAMPPLDHRQAAGRMAPPLRDDGRPHRDVARGVRRKAISRHGLREHGDRGRIASRRGTAFAGVVRPGVVDRRGARARTARDRLRHAPVTFGEFAAPRRRARPRAPRRRICAPATRSRSSWSTRPSTSRRSSRRSCSAACR